MDPITPTDEEVGELLRAAHTAKQVVASWRQADKAWKDWANIARIRTDSLARCIAALERICDGEERPEVIAQEALLAI